MYLDKWIRWLVVLVLVLVLIWFVVAHPKSQSQSQPTPSSHVLFHKTILNDRGARIVPDLGMTDSY